MGEFGSGNEVLDRLRLGAQTQGGPMTVEEARAVLEGCMQWIGWEQWETHYDEIVLDGRFTVPEVEAILTLMKHDHKEDR